MFVVVVGAGRIGFHLAKILVEEGCEVTVVDKNGDVCKEVADELKCDTVQGDATKPRVLDEAEIREADAVVALSGVDETNLVVCLMAKQMGAKNVAARLGALHYDERTLKKLGLDLVIYPEVAAAGYISELILKPDLLDLAYISRGDAEIVELEVKSKSKMCGKMIKEIESPEGSAIIALIERGSLRIPAPDTRIRPNDKVLILAKTEKIKQVKKLA